MPDYPFCTRSDVEARLLQRQTFSSSTKPTAAQVDQYIDEIASKLRGIVTAAGYDVDNLHAVSTETTAAISSGSDVSISVSDGSSFAAGDKIKIEGAYSGARVCEFTTVKSVSGNTLTADLSNSYDSGAAVKAVNDALEILRDLNAIGAAAMAEQYTFMGVSPNRSEHADRLWEEFNGSEEKANGIWAVRHIPGYLRGATTTDEAVSNETAFSYHTENPDDDYVDAGPTFSIYETKW